jgi:hypothetical protein
VRSQQILSRQQQTDETLQIHSHLNHLEAKLRQVTQEKADLQAQLKGFGGLPSPADSKGNKNKFPRSNSMPIPTAMATATSTPALVTSTKSEGEGGYDDEASLALINELTQKSVSHRPILLVLSASLGSQVS